MDSITIEVLDDGRIKVTTDPISPANHTSAEKLLRAIGEAGKTTRRKRGHGHHHTHQKEEVKANA